MVGEVGLSVFQLSGHTPGSIVLAYQESGGRAHLFTGDCLFPGGVGRTTNPAEFAVTAKLFSRYSDDAWVYPGHGADTALGLERPHLVEWRGRGW